MPLKSGRLTPKESLFAKVQAKHHDATYAAYAAGYASPQVAGSNLIRKEAVQAAIRQETQRFLYEDAGAIGCSVLAEIALDKRMQANSRVRAATELAKLANIGISDELAAKPDHELTAAELDAMRRKLEAQREAVIGAIAQLPTAAIDASGPSVFD